MVIKKDRNRLKRLREKHVLQIMRENISNKRYKLKPNEKKEYASIFESCPYTANVFLLVMELGKGAEIELPKCRTQRAVHFEYLVEIRFFNPFIWQL